MKRNNGDLIVLRAVRRMCAQWAKEARDEVGSAKPAFLEYVIASLSCTLGFWATYGREPGPRDDQRYGEFLRKIWSIQCELKMTDDQWRLALFRFRHCLALYALRRLEELAVDSSAETTQTVTVEVSQAAAARA